MGRIKDYNKYQEKLRKKAHSVIENGGTPEEGIYVSSGSKVTSFLLEIMNILDNKHHFHFTERKRGRHLESIFADNDLLEMFWSANTKRLTVFFTNSDKHKQQKFNNTEKKFLSQLHIGKASVEVTNPFSGNSTVLEPTAVALYDFIKGCEMLVHYGKMNQALYIFRKHWPEEYMILLD